MLVPRRVLLQAAGFLVLDDFIQMNNMRLRDAENLMLNFLTGQLSNEQKPWFFEEIILPCNMGIINHCKDPY